MDPEFKKAIETLAPFGKAVVKLAEGVDQFNRMNEYLIALDNRVDDAQVKFDRLSKATEAAAKREQEARMAVNEAEAMHQKIVDQTNTEIADKRRSATIEVEKMFSGAKNAYNEYVRDFEARKGEHEKELIKLEQLIEARKRDHKAIEDSLESIRRRVG